MVYCSRCGKEVDPQWTHCPYCGNPLIPTYQQSVPEKKKSRRKLVAGLIGLSGFLGLGYVAYRYYGDEIIAFIENISRQVSPSTETRTTTLTKTSELITSQSSATTSSTSLGSTTTTTTQTTPSSLTTQLTSTQTETSTSTTSSATSTTTSTFTISGLPERDWGSIVYPYLVVGGQAYYDEAQTNVRNDGDAPSFYTVLELYQGPLIDRAPEIKYIDHPLNSFVLTWRKVVTLNPGQRLDFDLSEIRPSYEVLIWVCYDPILDPRGFRMNSDAPIRTIFRNGLDRDRHVFVMGRRGSVEE